MNCPTCHVLVDPEEGCPRCDRAGNRASFLATLGALCLGVLVLAGGGYLAVAAMTAPTPFHGAWEGARFVVASEDGTHRYAYEADGGTSTVQGIAYFRGEAAGIEAFGMALVLHYLSPEQHEKVQREFGDAGRCPASYYNQHMHQLEVIAGGLEEAAALKAFPFQQYVPFRARGRVLRFAEGTRDGIPLKLRSGGRRATFFRLSELELGGETLRLE